MSAVAPPGPSAPTPGDSSQQIPQLSWEGDRMFNIYIYDYCNKRGYRNTARELLQEAEIPMDSTPPINARQGLLFEWWSVFWVLFGAKSNGNGPDEAMLYIQHQAQQIAQRQAQQRSQPSMQMNRFMNSVPRQPGVMTNGVGPPLLPGQAPGQGSVSFPMAATGPQPNGIPGPVGGPSAPGVPGQPPNFQPLMPGQRPPPLGMQQQQQQQQQRVPNGMPPFQSPTMAHSPPGGIQQHPQPPINQLGPSPHLHHMSRGGMLPPNGPQGTNGPTSMGPGQVPMQAGSYQQVGRSPSRTGTPGLNAMTQPSPSLASRQIPGGMPAGGDMRQAQHEQVITSELHRYSPNVLQSCMQEAGVAEKDIQACKYEEKQRILTVLKRRGTAKPGPLGTNNGGAGPSGSNQLLPSTHRNQQPPQQGQPQRGNKRSSTSPGEEHDIIPKMEASPPDRKRVRRSPMGMDQTPTMPPMSYPAGPPQGPGAPQQMSNGMMRGPMGNQPMNGFVPQPGMPGMPNMTNNPSMAMPLGPMGAVPQLGNAMSPGMNHPPGGMMASQMQMQQQLAVREAHYRQNLHNMQKSGMPPGVLNSALPTAGSPSSIDPSFMPGASQGPGAQFPAGMGPNNRMGPNKSMMPPPSPGMNGPAKDQQSNKDGKNGNLNSSNGLLDDLSRGALNAGQPGQGGQNMGSVTQGGTAPPTPVPGPNQSMTAPSPSAILSNTSSINLGPGPTSAGPDAMAPNLFSNEFIQSVASSLDELDSTLFKSEGDINFERDFGQWFNGDDVGSTLDLK